MVAENYIGNELELFDKAKNWKQYYGSVIKPYLNGVVMEVGAGIGATTMHLCNGTQQKWICLEPDPKLAQHIKSRIQAGTFPACCELREGILLNQPEEELYDAIIYIDVIEHIERDKDELQLAAKHLKPGGHLIILVPAHQWLFSPFDKAIGHYRRYDKKMLQETVPGTMKQLALRYMDSVGLLASIANKLILKQSYPTQKQVISWDTFMVPCSKITDVVTFYNLGKSVLGIWKK